MPGSGKSSDIAGPPSPTALRRARRAPLRGRIARGLETGSATAGDDPACPHPSGRVERSSDTTSGFPDIRCECAHCLNGRCGSIERPPVLRRARLHCEPRQRLPDASFIGELRQNNEPSAYVRQAPQHTQVIGIDRQGRFKTLQNSAQKRCRRHLAAMVNIMRQRFNHTWLAENACSRQNAGKTFQEFGKASLKQSFWGEN